VQAIGATASRALSVDLYGQIVADAIDGRQISGVGGHEDFVAGEPVSDSRSVMVKRCRSTIPSEASLSEPPACRSMTQMA
jgi:acyl-CoA hydrolase